MKKQGLELWLPRKNAKRFFGLDRTVKSSRFGRSYTIWEKVKIFLGLY